MNRKRREGEKYEDYRKDEKEEEARLKIRRRGIYIWVPVIFRTVGTPPRLVKITNQGTYNIGRNRFKRQKRALWNRLRSNLSSNPA